MLPCRKDTERGMARKDMESMIKIRVIHGGTSTLARERVAQAKEIFRQAFPDLADYADEIPDLLMDPVSRGYRTFLVTAEGSAGRVDGFALIMHYVDEECCFLDYIASRPGVRSGGIGGAIYEAVREQSLQLGAKGLYLEVQPDDPALTPDPAEFEESKKRIRFYEQYGARVIAGTDYDEAVGDPPSVAYLLFDGLGREHTLSAAEARMAARAILSKRFGHVTNPDYVERVIASFRDDPVRLREFRYIREERVRPVVESHRLEPHFAIVYTPKHEIHHVRERGYFERPIRANAVRESIAALGTFSQIAPTEHGEKALLSVHDAQFVRYLQQVCSKLKEDRPVYPDTFPLRREERRPKALVVQAGYYCIDTGTPLYRNAYVAARAAVDCALTAADEILSGRWAAYAACRPPGHHAGHRFFGGFCYFNNAAIVAQYLSSYARVAILDIDFHHGNGTQDIFYERDDVLTLSIHGHPDYAYPYFSGYAEETGAGAGLGFNRNFPLPPKTEGDKYLKTFERALEEVDRFKTDILVVGLGYDIIRGDPTGTFLLGVDTMRALGARLADFGRPIVVVQEGGYNIRNIRRGCTEFFRGLAENSGPKAEKVTVAR